MDKQITLIEKVSTLVEDIETYSEGLDQKVLLEAVKDQDLSTAVEADDLLDQLRKEGLI